MHTKDVLAEELDKVGLFEMAARAREGYYHDFLSPLDLPEIQLAHDLVTAAKTAHDFNDTTREAAIMKLRERHINGDFDASAEESDAWAASPEGQEAFKRLIKK